MQQTVVKILSYHNHATQHTQRASHGRTCVQTSDSGGTQAGICALCVARDLQDYIFISAVQYIFEEVPPRRSNGTRPHKGRHYPLVGYKCPLPSHGGKAACVSTPPSSARYQPKSVQHIACTAGCVLPVPPPCAVMYSNKRLGYKEQSSYRAHVSTQLPWSRSALLAPSPLQGQGTDQLQGL